MTRFCCVALVFSLFVYICFAINDLLKRRVRLLYATLSIHFRGPPCLVFTKKMRSNVSMGIRLLGVVVVAMLQYATVLWYTRHTVVHTKY